MLRVKARQLNRVLGPDTPLSRIDATAVDGFIATRVAEGAKRTTVQKELVTLRGALRLAKRQGRYTREIAAVMPIDFSPEYKPKSRALSEVEIDLLAGALAPKRVPLFYFLLATGATYPSEVAPMQRGDIDAKRGFVLLRGTKRSSRHRTVPVVSFAKPWLAAAVRGLPFERWTNVRRDLHVACALLSTCAACRKADRATPKPGCRRCAAQHFAPVSPNDLRRSVATLMRARGVEPQLIGAFLGHNDSRMAERVYGRLSPAQLAHLLDQRLRATARIQRTA